MNWAKLIAFFSFSANPKIITFDGLPIGVIFPPIFVPAAIAKKSMKFFMPNNAVKLLAIGKSMATTGILSIRAHSPQTGYQIIWTQWI